MKKIFLFMFSLLLCVSTMISPVLAAEEYPPFPRDYYDYAIDIVYTDLDGYNKPVIKLTSFGAKTQEAFDKITIKYNGKNSSGSDIVHARSDGGTYLRFDYTLVNGAWSMGPNNTESNTYFYFDGEVRELLYSSVPIADEDGNVFFPEPPATLEGQIMAMVAEKIPELQTNLMTKVMTIVPYGVGCLALLISLALLVKVLRRYLPR